MNVEDINPYKSWHMQKAFRLGWEAAEQGLDREQAQIQVQAQGKRLNQMTTAAWWKDFDTNQSQRLTS